MAVPVRTRLLVGAAIVPIVLVGAALHLASARAQDGAAKHEPPAARNLVLDDAPRDMGDFLTSVTKDVDRYWTGVFADAGLPEPRVSYAWTPTGSTAAYSPGDDTILISEEFANGILDGGLDTSLPGASQGYGSAKGDFAVAYIVAHEYGHQVQNELGLDRRYGGQVPTSAFELQADCFAGTWAKHADAERRLEEGDLQEALDSAMAVGDFDPSAPGHHGTPDQRREAFTTGFKAGDPASCNAFLAS
jgi:uncharacterized protein